jgi:hypothetical protein
VNKDVLKGVDQNRSADKSSKLRHWLKQLTEVLSLSLGKKIWSNLPKRIGDETILKITKHIIYMNFIPCAVIYADMIATPTFTK